jgi:membrane protein implicated in regulation of membrane protease activity
MMDILFGDLAPWFTAPAMLGTGVLFIQLLMGELGGDGALDLDLDLDIDGHTDHPGMEFGILSLQSISAFFLGYGWVGLAAYRFLNVGFTGAAVIAVLAGIGVAWLMVWLLRTFLKLQNNTNVSIHQTVGLEGEVYATVPPEGTGRGEIILVINQSQHNYFATQEGSEPIQNRSRVRVLRADAASNTIVVELV